MTSQAELEHVAFELFEANGFEQTTVEDIAMAAGIGRRTFFRYFPSKNDIPWGTFELELERMRARLKACPHDVQLMDAIRVALVDFNKVECSKGMNITIVTTAGNDERAQYLLRELGMPFAR